MVIRLQALLFDISNSIYQIFPSDTSNLHTSELFQVNNYYNPKNMIEQLIVRTLTGVTILVKNGPEIKDIERAIYISQTSRMKPHHQIGFSIISRTVNGFKYCNLIFTIPLNINHCLNTVSIRLGVMAITRYYTFPKISGMVLHYQMALCHTQNTRWRISFLSRGKTGVF